MVTSSQCPKCKRHGWPELLIVEDKRTNKKYVIERCIFEDCNFNKDIWEYKELKFKQNPQK